MKKLDEIMELMADEMADFKTSLEKLEALSKELKEMSIPISTSAIDENLKSFLQNQEEADSLNLELLRDFNRRLKGVSLIPRYILTLFGSCLLLILVILGYFIFAYRITEENRFEFFRSNLESESESYTLFFSEYPKIKEDYCNWMEQTYK